MAKSSRFVRNVLRLCVVALVCTLPFLLLAGGAIHYARGVDTLPLDEYGGLTWSVKGHKLFYLHRPLIAGAESPYELWSHETRQKRFKELTELPESGKWELADKWAGRWLMVASAEQSLMFSGGKESRLVNLDFAKDWLHVPGDGKRHFFSAHESAMPFEQFVDVEDAPDLEAAATPAPDSGLEPGEEAEDEIGPPLPGEMGPPTRSGLKLSKLSEDGKSLIPVLSIPYSKASDKPEVLYASESSDQRFLALAIRFGERGQPGLWVHDSESRRLLWSRVICSGEVYGVAWSPDSVSLSLADSKGVVVVPNVLGIESTRFEAAGLGRVTPVWGNGSSILLAGAHSVHRLDRNQGKAEVVFDGASGELGLEQMVLSPDGSKLAFFSHKNGRTELVTKVLGSDQEDSRLGLPGSLAEENRNSWAYRVGDALAHSAKYWLGR